MENQKGDSTELICFLCQSDKSKHLSCDDLQLVREQKHQEEDVALELEESPANVRADDLRKKMLSSYQDLVQQFESNNVNVDSLCPICFTNEIELDL